MLYFRIAVLFCVTIYLLCQAITDAKSGMVSWWANTIMLLLSFILWIGTVFYYVPSIKRSSLFFESSLFALVLYLSTKNLPLIKKVMQPADAKAFMIIYFASAFSMSISFAPIAVLFTLIVGHTFFLIWHRLIKKTDKKERKPYFPFILLGYLFTELVFIVLLLISC